MSLPADGVNANTLAETTTIPTGKKLIFLDPDTNEGGIITLENLTKQILSSLTSQTFNLDQGNKTLLAALNELNSNVKYEEKFTLEPSIGINFPIKIKHDYLLVFKYIDKGNIKNIRICVLCSKQKEGTEGTASWIAEGIDSVDISMTTGLCTIISKSTWLSLSVHEL